MLKNGAENKDAYPPLNQAQVIKLKHLSLVSLARSIRRAVLLRIDVVERAVDAFQRAYDMFFVSVLGPGRPSNRALLIVEVARGCAR